MRTKWFIINEKEKTFKSKRKAKTLNEAWDKTLLKWGLISDEYNLDNHLKTCGLCNIYWKIKDKNWAKTIILCECPLNDTNGKPIDAFDGFPCLPFENNPDLQYLWLLFVREASK